MNLSKQSFRKGSRNFIPDDVGAFLGISLGSPYYSRQRINHYLAFARLKFSHFAFLVGDEVFRFTLAGLKCIPVDQALIRAQAIGSELETMLTGLIQTSGINCEVIRWADVTAIPEYAALLDSVTAAHRTNPHFRKAVRDQIFVNLGDRVIETGLPRNPSIDNSVSALFDSYILEEVAGLITVSEFTPYTTEIYPGRDLRILRLIYKDTFSEITGTLPKVRKRHFLQLRID